MENRVKFFESSDSIGASVEKLIAKMEEGSSILELSVKDVQPCLESILSEAVNDDNSSQLIISDLVARITSAEKQLNEALCLVRDALSSVSTGCKFYKENVPEFQNAG